MLSIKLFVVAGLLLAFQFSPYPSADDLGALSPAAGAVSTIDKPRIHHFTLDNGLKIVVLPNNKVPAVAFMVYYNVGGVDVYEGKTGIAHYLEHLMFKETEHLQRGEYSDILARYGADNNAYTTPDYTVYFQTIIKDYLPTVLALEAERMKYLTISKEVADLEREVVMEERYMRVDNIPRSQLLEQMREKLFDDDPYSSPTIGHKRDIENFQPAEAQLFYERYYGPNNAMLIFSGDVRPAVIHMLAKKYFGHIKRRDTAARPKHTTDIFSGKHDAITIRDKRVSAAELIQLYAAPSAVYGNTEHALPLVLLAYITGGGETSVLYQSLVVEQRLATNIYAHYDDVSRGPSVFGIYATPAEGVSLEELKEAVDSELAYILHKGISEKDMQRFANLLRAETIYARDGLKNIAFSYGKALSVGLQDHYIAELPSALLSITQAQVQDAAHAVFTRSKQMTGYLQHEGVTP